MWLLRPPRYLTPRALLLVATLIASAVVGTSISALGLARGATASFAEAVHVCTLTHAAIVAWVATRSPLKRPVWVLAAATLAGGLCPIASLGVCALSGEPMRNAVVLVGGIFLGALFGAPLGLLGGVAFEVAAWPLRKAAPFPALDSSARSSVWLGGCLVLTGAVAALAKVLLAGSAWSIPSTIACVVGLVLFAVGGGELVLRRRWLARAQAGDVQGWSVLSCPQGEHEELPSWDSVEDSQVRDGMLVRHDPLQLGPYRNGREPIALVRLDGRNGIREIFQGWIPPRGAPARVAVAFLVGGAWLGVSIVLCLTFPVF